MQPHDFAILIGPQFATWSTIACVTLALSCVYMIKITRLEDAPGTLAQCFAFGFTGIFAIMNGLFHFDDWMLVDGHRPTGMLLNISFAATVVIMCVRGHMSRERDRGHQDGGQHP